MICKINSYLKFISLASFIFFNSHAIADECEVTPMLSPTQSTITQPYSGDCKNGKAEGKGSYQFKQTSNDRLVLVQGEFKNGMLNGSGSLSFIGALGNSKVEGNYVDNLMDGNGTASYDKFGVYKNEWKKGRVVNGHEIRPLTNGTFEIKLYKNGFTDKTCRDDTRIDDFCTVELKEKLKNGSSINVAEKTKQLPNEIPVASTISAPKDYAIEFSLIDDQCSSQTILARYDNIEELQSSVIKLNVLTDQVFIDAKNYFNKKCDKYIKNKFSPISRYQLYLISKIYTGKCSLGQGSDNLDACLKQSGAIAALGKGRESGSILGTYTWNSFADKEEVTRSQKILNDLVLKYQGKIYYRERAYFNKTILIGVPPSINLKSSNIAIPLNEEIKKIIKQNIVYTEDNANKKIDLISFAYETDIKSCGNINAIGCIDNIIWVSSNLDTVKAINYEINEKDKSDKLKIANEIKDKANEKTKVLAKRTNAEGWRALQLKTNAFAHEGKIYLFNTALTKMETADSGIFNGDYYFSNIPKNAITSSNQLIIAGKVIGMKSVKTPFGGEISIPHMRYVGHEFCAETDCKDFTGLK